MLFPAWFVVTRFGARRELQIWNIAVCRLGIGAVLPAPVVLRQDSRLAIAV